MEEQKKIKGKLYSKSYLIEAQIMHQIKMQEKRLTEIEEMRNKIPCELPEKEYWTAFYYAHGAINQLMIVLTCYDNPLSNFLAYESKNKL